MKIYASRKDYVYTEKNICKTLTDAQGIQDQWMLSL